MAVHRFVNPVFACVVVFTSVALAFVLAANNVFGELSADAVRATLRAGAAFGIVATLACCLLCGVIVDLRENDERH